MVVVSMMGKGIVVFVVVVVDERIMLVWGFLFVFSAFLKGRVSYRQYQTGRRSRLATMMREVVFIRNH